MLSVAIWLRFSNQTVKLLSNFNTLNILLLVMLAVGVMFLVIALIGTCGANMKNKILLICYIAATSIAAMTEIVGIFVYATSKGIFQENFQTWYRGVFRLFNTESQAWFDNKQLMKLFTVLFSHILTFQAPEKSVKLWENRSRKNVKL